MRELIKSLKLFKISLKDAFFSNRRTGKARILFPIFLLVIFTLMFICSFQYSLMFCGILAEGDLQYVSILMFYLIAAVIQLMMTTYKARGALYGAKDTDFLLALPVNNSCILISRILNMMFYNYLIGVIFMIAPTIAFSLTGGTVNWLSLLIGVIFMPFIPTMIACCVGSVIGATISKMRYKSIVEAILSFLAIVLLFGVAGNFGDILTEIFDKSEDVIYTFKSVYFPVVWLYEAVRLGNGLSLLKFVGANVICLGLFIKIFNNQFIKINQNMVEKSTAKKFEYKLAKKRGKTTALLFKELRLYTQSAIHMLNTCFGSVTILLFSFATFVIDRDGLLNSLSGIGLNMTPELFIWAICGTMIALSCTTAASISLEGTSLWCLRSLPVPEMTIFNSKMLVDICFIMPANIIAALIIGFNWKVPIQMMLLIAFYMALVGVAMTHFGLLLNLLFPKLKFKTDVEVVKQSMASNLAVYIPLFIMPVALVTYMVLQTVVPFYQFVLACSGILVIVIIILRLIIKTYGVNKFQTLYC